MKIETEMIFLRFGSEIRSTGNGFQFDRIWSSNQTPHISEMNFRDQFEVNSNATLVDKVKLNMMMLWFGPRFLVLADYMEIKAQMILGLESQVKCIA